MGEGWVSDWLTKGGFGVGVRGWFRAGFVLVYGWCIASVGGFV